MLRQGASLGEIGELLGHRHPQTTKIYTKVDLEALRTLALQQFSIQILPLRARKVRSNRWRAECRVGRGIHLYFETLK
jgi:hypothetical protein